MTKLTLGNLQDRIEHLESGKLREAVQANEVEQTAAREALAAEKAIYDDAIDAQADARRLLGRIARPEDFPEDIALRAALAAFIERPVRSVASERVDGANANLKALEVLGAIQKIPTQGTAKLLALLEEVEKWGNAVQDPLVTSVLGGISFGEVRALVAEKIIRDATQVLKNLPGNEHKKDYIEKQRAAFFEAFRVAQHVPSSTRQATLEPLLEAISQFPMWELMGCVHVTIANGTHWETLGIREDLESIIGSEASDPIRWAAAVVWQAELSTLRESVEKRMVGLPEPSQTLIGQVKGLSWLLWGLEPNGGMGPALEGLLAHAERAGEYARIHTFVHVASAVSRYGRVTSSDKSIRRWLSLLPDGIEKLPPKLIGVVVKNSNEIDPGDREQIASLERYRYEWKG